MNKKLRRLVKRLLTPTLREPMPALYGEFSPSDENTKHHVEMRNIELANLRLQKEALEKNLIVMHRTMLIALLAVFVSIALGIIAISAKQDIKVNIHEQSAVQSTP